MIHIGKACSVCGKRLTWWNHPWVTRQCTGCYLQQRWSSPLLSSPMGPVFSFLFLAMNLFFLLHARQAFGEIFQDMGLMLPVATVFFLRSDVALILAVLLVGKEFSRRNAFNLTINILIFLLIEIAMFLPFPGAAIGPLARG